MTRRFREGRKKFASCGIDDEIRICRYKDWQMNDAWRAGF